MKLVSSAFPDGAAIPQRLTCDGQNLSPPLQCPTRRRGRAALSCSAMILTLRKAWHHWAAGGITHQIEDGVNGVLVDSVEQAAERIVTLLKDRALAARLGRQAKESVRSRFLMTRLMEEWLDLIGSFEASFILKRSRGA